MLNHVGGTKGVRPIAYDPADAHRALWTTLSAWSIRATNPDSWHEAVVDLAEKARAKSILMNAAKLRICCRRYTCQKIRFIR